MIGLIPVCVGLTIGIGAIIALTIRILGRDRLSVVGGVLISILSCYLWYVVAWSGIPFSSGFLLDVLFTQIKMPWSFVGERGLSGFLAILLLQATLGAIATAAIYVKSAPLMPKGSSLWRSLLVLLSCVMWNLPLLWALSNYCLSAQPKLVYLPEGATFAHWNGKTTYAVESTLLLMRFPWIFAVWLLAQNATYWLFPTRGPFLAYKYVILIALAAIACWYARLAFYLGLKIITAM